jgi:hypothetical protein
LNKKLTPPSTFTSPSNLYTEQNKSEMASLEDLAAQVNSHTKELTQLLAETKLPLPSFGPDAAPSPPHGKGYEKVQAARMALIESAQAIRDLALGPDDCITAYSDGVSKQSGAKKKVVNDTYRSSTISPRYM